jgi:hypothetical protein
MRVLLSWVVALALLVLALAPSSAAACNLQCGHGGLPNAACSACDCVPASLWSGADCNTYDDTKLVDSYYTYLAAVHDEALDARRALEKTLLPGQVGFGVDVVTGNRKLPVVALTYDMDSAAHTFTDNQGSKFALPLEATFTPIYGEEGDWPLPGSDYAIFFKQYVFRSWNEYREKLKEWISKRTVMAGIFQQPIDVEVMFDRFFKGATTMGVSQAHLQTHRLSLKGDTSSWKLDKQAERALMSLPPKYETAQEKRAYHLFIEYWGTSFASSTVSGGVMEQITAFPKHVTPADNGPIIKPGAPPYFISDYGRQTLLDLQEAEMKGMMLNDGGQHVRDQQSATWGSVGSMDYTDFRTLTEFSCYGGNPETTCKRGDFNMWLDGLDHLATTLDVENMRAISDLVPDPVVSANIATALAAYIAEQEAKMDEIDTCPDCYTGVCVAPSDRCECPESETFVYDLLRILRMKYPQHAHDFPYGPVDLHPMFDGKHPDCRACDPSRENWPECNEVTIQGACEAFLGMKRPCGCTEDGFVSFVV